MKVIPQVVGTMLETNCYLLIDEAENAAALIDPGGDADLLLRLLDENGATLRAVFLTHGHFDHVGAVDALCRRFPGLPVYLHAADMAQTDRHLFPLTSSGIPLRYYDEGDVLPLGGLSVRVLHTPGHSAGSVVLQAENCLFTGDTLFAGSCGRTDLAGGDGTAMLASLRRLAALDGDFTVFPGHMDSSTLARERAGNPFMKLAAEEKDRL